MNKSKLNYGKTFIIGFGFFTTAITWSLYNSYIPIFLKRFITSSAIIGIVTVSYTHLTLPTN